MPKLSKDAAKEVEAAEDGFAALEEGEYLANLTNVEVRTPKTGGDDYWSWEFTIPTGQPHAGRKFWTNTSLGESSRPFMKRMFAVFGVSPDTDTELLYGRTARIVLVQKVIPYGQRAGEMGNEIQKVLPYDGPPLDGDANIPF